MSENGSECCTSCTVYRMCMLSVANGCPLSAALPFELPFCLLCLPLELGLDTPPLEGAAG